MLLPQKQPRLRPFFLLCGFHGSLIKPSLCTEGAREGGPPKVVEGSLREGTVRRRPHHCGPSRTPVPTVFDGRIGFPVQGKLSPKVTDELFIRSVRRTRYLSNKEK